MIDEEELTEADLRDAAKKLYEKAATAELTEDSRQFMRRYAAALEDVANDFDSWRPRECPFTEEELREAAKKILEKANCDCGDTEGHNRMRGTAMNLIGVADAIAKGHDIPPEVVDAVLHLIAAYE